MGIIETIGLRGYKKIGSSTHGDGDGGKEEGKEAGEREKETLPGSPSGD